jgi:DNA (cytosine-5)-methyltransferase 1
MRPVIIDACCCQGGAARGYQNAGFRVIGIDVDPQPRYVGDEFIQGDALALISNLDWVASTGAVAIHASWPCQFFKLGTLRTNKPGLDLVTPGREAMNATGLPWVIENVMEAPLNRDRSIVLCANTFGLRTYRHRRFEYSKHWELTAPAHAPHVKRAPNRQRLQRWLAGDHASITGDVGTYVGPEAMGIDWMTGNGLSEAIPPAYTEWVGRQLMAHLRGPELVTTGTGSYAPPAEPIEAPGMSALTDEEFAALESGEERG